jgi:hypothetical protein
MLYSASSPSCTRINTGFSGRKHSGVCMRIYATQHWKTTIVASVVYEHATIVFVFGIFASLGDAAQAS